MGIQVMVEGENNIVGSYQNFLSGNRLNSSVAMRLFSVLCGYRLVDVLVLLGGTIPLETMVERTEAPTGSLPVHVFRIYSWV